MRCDQYIGLNDWARQFVSAQQTVREVGVRIAADGKVVPFDRTEPVAMTRKEVIGQITGAWIDVVANLHRYTTPNGKVYEEFVQCSPWSGGPMYFIALKNKKGSVVRQSLWIDDEIC
jgi:hypothetical protein